MKYILLSCFLLLCTFQSIAEKGENKAKKVFRVGVSDQSHYPLFDFNRSGDMGLAHNILKLFAERNGFSFEYVPMNYVKLQDAIEKGDIDFIFPDNPKWRTYRYTREHNIYSLPFMQAVSSTFVASENRDIPIEQVKSVGIPYGYSSLTWYAALEKYGIDTMTTSGLEASIQYLYRGTIMAADIEYNVANHLASVLPNLDSIVVNTNLPSAPVRYHLSTVKHILVIERFSHFVSKNKEELEQLRQQYQVQNYMEVFGNDGKNAFDSWIKLD